MKKLLLAAGILLVAAGVLSLMFAAVQCVGYYQIMDGSPVLYDRLRRGMVVFFIAGLVLAVMGIGCLFARLKR